MQSQHRAIKIGYSDGHPRARTGWKTNHGSRQSCRRNSLIDNRRHIVLRKSGPSPDGTHEITLGRQSASGWTHNESSG